MAASVFISLLIYWKKVDRHRGNPSSREERDKMGQNTCRSGEIERPNIIDKMRSKSNTEITPRITFLGRPAE